MFTGTKARKAKKPITKVRKLENTKKNIDIRFQHGPR